MCYSQFNEIVEHIARMDADVISIEASRSNMDILHAFHDFAYPNQIGPGVYDIHSPRVPSMEEIAALLARAERHIPRERLWVNPDCGLKTRTWEEVAPALEHLVAAAHRRRSPPPLTAAATRRRARGTRLARRQRRRAVRPHRRTSPRRAAAGASADRGAAAHRRARARSWACRTPGSAADLRGDVRRALAPPRVGGAHLLPGRPQARGRWHTRR